MVSLSSVVGHLLTVGVGLVAVTSAMNLVRNGVSFTTVTTDNPLRPYTVFLSETTRDRSGQNPITRLYQEARSSKGVHTVRIEGPIGDAGAQVFRAIHAASGIEILTNDLTERKSTRRATAWASRDPGKQCTARDLGEALQRIENVGDYRAAVISQPQITEPSRTSWYALDMSCALVRERFTWNDGVTTEKTLVRLVAGEPEVSFVTVPGHYIETAPSGLLSYDKPRSVDGNAPLDKMDRAYYNQRP